MVQPRDGSMGINKPILNGEERAEILKILEENALTSADFDGGKRVREFEQLMREYLKVKNVIAVNSGTSALHAALLAAGIGPGDEVLLPSFTFVATANAVVAVGAKPVFVEVNKNYTIDTLDIELKMTPKTKAIIAVHLYGHPCDMTELKEIACYHGVEIIEDACQSIGSTYKGKQTGTLGRMGCFSLYASKVLTAGEGGAIVTNDDALAVKLKMIRNHGMVHGYDTKVFGLNLRLPELSAAIAKIQMKKLDNFLRIRRKNAEALLEYLEGERWIIRPYENENKKFNWYLFTINVQQRDRVKELLRRNGIGAAVYYDPPVHLTPYYSSPNINLPYTEWHAKHVLSLPVHHGLDVGDMKWIATVIKEVCRPKS